MLGYSYTCNSCHKDCTFIARQTFNFIASDDTNVQSLTTFNEEAEKILTITAAELYGMKKDEERKHFSNVVEELKENHIFIQVGPSHHLSTSYIIRWSLKTVSID